MKYPDDVKQTFLRILASTINWPKAAPDPLSVETHKGVPPKQLQEYFRYKRENYSSRKTQQSFLIFTCMYSSYSYKSEKLSGKLFLFFQQYEVCYPYGMLSFKPAAPNQAFSGYNKTKHISVLHFCDEHFWIPQFPQETDDFSWVVVPGHPVGVVESHRRLPQQAWMGKARQCS